MGNATCHCTDGSHRDPAESPAPERSLSAFVEEVPSRAPVLPPDTGEGRLSVRDEADKTQETDPLAVAVQAGRTDEGAPKFQALTMDTRPCIDSAGAQKGDPPKHVTDETFGAKLPVPTRPNRSVKKIPETEQEMPQTEEASSLESPAKLYAPKFTHATFLLIAHMSMEVTFESYDEPLPLGSLVVTSVSKDSVLYRPLFGRKGVRQGDIVTEVNGCSGSKTMLFDLLQQAKIRGGNLNVTLRKRPKIYQVKLVKTSPDQDMGFEVAVNDDHPGRLTVKRIYRVGALPAWIKQNPTLHVFTGDWITAVQGKRCSATEMHASLCSLWENGADCTLEIAIQSGKSGEKGLNMPPAPSNSERQATDNS